MIILKLMADKAQQIDGKNGLGLHRRLERGIKPRRNLLFRTSRSLSLAGISFLGVTLTLLIVIMMFPYVPEPESGIFIIWAPYSEAVNYEYEYVTTTVRIVSVEKLNRPRSYNDTFPNLTFVFKETPFLLEQLECYIEVIRERPSDSLSSLWKDKFGRVHPVPDYLDYCAFFISVLLVIDEDVLEILSHGDFIAICDMFKMHDFCRIIVTTE